MKQLKPWFRDTEKPFESEDPFFFDPQEFHWTKEIEANWQVIRDELRSVIANSAENPLAKYPQEGEKVVGKNKWRTSAMMFWGYQITENCELFPKTWALIKDIPNLMALSFNLLEEGTTIKPHIGDTNAIARCHMGLEIPASLPSCGFRVGTQTKSWEEGKFFMFNDAYEHTAWNNTRANRYVLVIDVMREQYTHTTNSTASRVLAVIKQEILRDEIPLIKVLFKYKIFVKLLFNSFRLVHRVQILTGANKF